MCAPISELPYDISAMIKNTHFFSHGETLLVMFLVCFFSTINLIPKEKECSVLQEEEKRFHGILGSKK